eukprot:352033-Chlamydomonas_euryale.AAC.2
MPAAADAAMPAAADAAMPAAADAAMPAAAAHAVAKGVEPLRYQWFKDDKKITIATADTYKLIIAGVGQPDEGLYYCQVRRQRQCLSGVQRRACQTALKKDFFWSGVPGALVLQHHVCLVPWCCNTMCAWCLAVATPYVPDALLLQHHVCLVPCCCNTRCAATPCAFGCDSVCIGSVV